jgi:hypothetical protein
MSRQILIFFFHFFSRPRLCLHFVPSSLVTLSLRLFICLRIHQARLSPPSLGKTPEKSSHLSSSFFFKVHVLKLLCLEVMFPLIFSLLLLRNTRTSCLVFHLKILICTLHSVNLIISFSFASTFSTVFHVLYQLFDLLSSVCQVSVFLNFLAPRN